MMKNSKIVLSLVLVLSLMTGLKAQDNRTTTTKVADLLVQMPVNDWNHLGRLMLEMETFGQEGLEIVAKGIVIPGTGNDTRVRFAMESYSRHLSLSENESLVRQWEKICIAGVQKATNPDVKTFYMTQLNYVGGPETLEALVPYLNDKVLAGPAIEAMTMTDREQAAAIYSKHLKGNEEVNQIALVNAIGEARMGAHALVLIDLYPAASDALKKALLRALSKMENNASVELLHEEAQKADYNRELTHATDYLLDYGFNHKDRQEEASERVAKTILKKSNTEIYRIKARLLLAACEDSDEAIAVLVQAMKEADKAHRVAAMEEAIRLNSAVEPWVKVLTKSKNPEVQQEVLYLFGRLNNGAAVETVQSFLDNEEDAVRWEALISYAILKKEAAVPVIAGYMAKYSGEKDAATAQEALMVTVNKENAAELVAAYGSFSKAMQKATLQVLGAKRVQTAFDLVKSALSDSGEGLSGVAYENLKYVANDGHLSDLLELYDTAASSQKEAVGQAIVWASKTSKDVKAYQKKVAEHAQNKGLSNTYIQVYAGFGGRSAVALVSDLYASGDKETKNQVVKALSKWSDATAVYALFDICQGDNPEKHKQMAFSAYVSQTLKSDVPDDQKLLLLRKIMPYAGSNVEKLKVIKGLGEVKTYLSFVYLQTYLDEAPLRHEVANSLVRVALPSEGADNGLSGAFVKENLKVAKELVTGPDSQYLKIDIDNYLAMLGDEKGFVSMFDGESLEGWQGFTVNPIQKEKLSAAKLKALQKEADKKMRENWSVKDGMIVFDGKGANLCSVKEYGDFEMIVDWRITREGDSGIYLRGTPQVQIWDTTLVKVGAQVGSGGLYNNQKHERIPLVVADNPIYDWNTFRIKMVGERVTVYLNGQLVVDNVVMENYWDRKQAIFPVGPIELQAHGSDLAFRDIYVREINAAEHNLTADEKAEGFVSLFNGVDLSGWIGNKTDYLVENGVIVIRPEGGGHGNLYTEKEYSDFNYRFDFKLTPGANNGLGIRTPTKGDAAYEGMELQILDNTAEVYANLKPYQYHGSVYGIIAAKRGFLKPVGEWNQQEVIVKGNHVKITLNGEVIVDGDIAEASKNGTADGKKHPGLKRTSGHIGFLGHGSVVFFRNIRIKEL
jgi:hypothetical protein